MSKESKWISATNPPKKDEEKNYLVWMPRLEEEPVVLKWNTECFYDERAGEDRTEDVTHYMPLPSPPQLQKKEGKG